MNKQLKLKVLQYWHKVEFFQSNDLKDFKNAKERIIQISNEQLLISQNELPWFNRNQIRKAGIGYYPDQSYLFKLYLGLFKQSEISDMLIKQFPNEETNEDWKQRRSDSGTTCSATIDVTNEGLVIPESLALSTAPWALGRLGENKLESVQYKQFKKSVVKLTELIQALINSANQIKEEAGLPEQLTTFEIIKIQELLGNWAGFTPKKPVQHIYIRLDKPKNSVNTAEKTTGDQINSIQLPQQVVGQLEQIDLTKLIKISSDSNSDLKIHKRENGQDDSEEIPQVKDDKDIQILNSFFINDIEKAISAIETDCLGFNDPLAKYLTEKIEYHPDLLESKGQRMIGKNLSIQNTPLGHWPDDDSHTMSLMQQFALNSINQELESTGIFSINGPPGTGKTTMLRDLIANNIVERARVLAEFDNPEDGFCKDVTILVDDKPESGIKCLIPELTGFEMVVVSSNNAAIENVTRELPQISALGEEYQTIDYFKPVAQKLAAKHSKKSTQKIYPLSENDDCWGLISAVLGKQKNQQAFLERVFIEKSKSLLAQKGAENYQTFWELIKNPNHSKLSFLHAKTAFIKQLNHVSLLINEISTIEKYKKEAYELTIYEKNIKIKERQLTKLSLRLDRLKAKKQGSIKALLTLKWKYYCGSQILISAFDKRCKVRKAKLDSQKIRLEEKRINLDKQKPGIEKLEEKYQEVRYYLPTVDLEDIGIQRSSFGHCHTLNQARAKLTIDALNLHQAWIKEACKRGFSKNIFQIGNALSGKIKRPADAIVVWQSLFMLVPVISSTFASFERQFNKLNLGDIGWLFVDESGQATPQQAVGALLRSKRAVVVGDPLQIEPVFTIPPQFVSKLAEKTYNLDPFRWSPAIHSVQTIADIVNPFGTKKISSSIWLGCPLRVHRRCKDPMFSISNEIAYTNKMIHGEERQDIEDHPVWGPSTWFDVSGKTSDGQYVNSQGEVVLELLTQYYQRTNQLPDLYIIAPFRKIRSNLINLLNKTLGSIGVRDYKKWVGERVGTVHTFQGKEEKTVFFVLGVDDQSIGSAKWAASKVNLLNVAVSRAKKHFFIIGDRKIWSGLEYFNEAANRLEVISW